MAGVPAGGPVRGDRSEPDTNPLWLESGLLVFTRGPRAGEQVPLEPDRTLVGRHSEADIFLEDVTVSRRHSEFVAHDDGHVLRDMGSLNGTYVNGDRVDSVVLRAGDQVQIGKYRFTYQPGRPTP